MNKKLKHKKDKTHPNESSKKQKTVENSLGVSDFSGLGKNAPGNVGEGLRNSRMNKNTLWPQFNSSPSKD